MDVCKNSGTPKSSNLIGFSIINHPFWGYPYFWKHPHGSCAIHLSFPGGFFQSHMDPKWEARSIEVSTGNDGKRTRFLAISKHLLDLWIRWKIMGFQLAFPQLVSWSRISEPSTVYRKIFFQLNHCVWIVSPIFLHNKTPNILAINVTCWCGKRVLRFVVFHYSCQLDLSSLAPAAAYFAHSGLPLGFRKRLISHGKKKDVTKTYPPEN